MAREGLRGKGVGSSADKPPPAGVKDRSSEEGVFFLFFCFFVFFCAGGGEGEGREMGSV
jgi:hypothetical protein